MVDFHEVRFPTTISRGSSGGPRRRTDIVTLRSGYEERNSVWADSRREYDAGLGVRDINSLYEVLVFFETRLGRLYGFRWKDWADYKSGPPNRAVDATDQKIDLIAGQLRVYQLVKSYSSGPFSWERLISKPVLGATALANDGDLLVEGADFLVDTTNGLVYTAFELSGEVRAGFEFDVPVRFTNDHLDITVELFSAGQVPQVNVIEVKTQIGAASEDNLNLALWNWLQISEINTSVNVHWAETWGTE